MLTNQELRTAAANEGKKTYSNGRPCQKGHLADRYVSNNMCVECTNANNTKYKTLAAHAARRRNLANSSQMVSATLTVQAQYKSTIDSITDIMYEGGHRADMLAQYIMLIGDSTLTREDIERLHIIENNRWDQTKVAVRTSDAGHAEVQIMGEWYLTNEVAEVLTGTRRTVSRIPYRKGE